MDSAYLKDAVGDVLSAGLAAVAIAQPSDGVEYLAYWLKNYVKDQERQRELHALKEKQEKVARESAERAKKESEERAKVNKAKEDWLAAIAQMIDEDASGMYAAVMACIKTFTKAKNVYIAEVERDPNWQPPVDEEDKPPEGEEGAAEAAEPAPAEEKPADDQGEEGEAEAEAGPAEPAAPPPPAEPKPPKKIFHPGNLKYVAANKDNLFMLNQTLPYSEETTLVSFEALRAFEQRHVPNVLNDPRVHFFRMKGVGAYLATPVRQWDGVYSELIGCDTLMPGKGFDAEEMEFVQRVAEAMYAAHIERHQLYLERLAREEAERLAREEEERQRREEAARLLEEQAAALIPDEEIPEGVDPAEADEVVEEGGEKGDQLPAEEEQSEGRALLKAITSKIFELDMKKAAAEIRAYNVPPKGVHEALKGVYFLLGHKRHELEDFHVLKMMVGEELLEEIREFDPAHKQPKANRLNAQAAVKGLTQEAVNKASKAAGLLFEWVKVNLALRKQAIAARRAAAAEEEEARRLEEERLAAETRAAEEAAAAAENAEAAPAEGGEAAPAEAAEEPAA
eukprot:tig00001229_g7839.t1